MECCIIDSILSGTIYYSEPHYIIVMQTLFSRPHSTVYDILSVDKPSFLLICFSCLSSIDYSSLAIKRMNNCLLV